MIAASVLAWIFGPYLLIQGIWMFAQKENLLKICESIRKTPAAIYIAGWSSLLIGLTLINFFNVWQANIALVLTLLGWGYFVRGLIILFTPQLFLKLEIHEKRVMPTTALIRIIWGALILWFGMMVG
jgi:hypothetical protein